MSKIHEVRSISLRDPLSVTVLGCTVLLWLALGIVHTAFSWSETEMVANPVLPLLGLTVATISWVTARAVWIQQVLRQGTRVKASLESTDSEGVVFFSFDYRWGGRSFRRRGWAFQLPYAAFLLRDARTEVAFLKGRPERPVITRLFDEMQ